MNARDPALPVQPDEAVALAAFVNRAWDDEIVPRVAEYIAIPAKSPMFDADWAANGHIDRVIRDAASWVERQQVAGLKLEASAMTSGSASRGPAAPMARWRCRPPPTRCRRCSTGPGSRR